MIREELWSKLSALVLLGIEAHCPDQKLINRLKIQPIQRISTAFDPKDSP
jgi:hypothetical protein